MTVFLPARAKCAALFGGAVLLAFCAGTFAEDRLVKIDTRPGVSVSFWYMKRPDASATVVLLPGGAGGAVGTPRSRTAVLAFPWCFQCFPFSCRGAVLT